MSLEAVDEVDPEKGATLLLESGLKPDIHERHKYLGKDTRSINLSRFQGDNLGGSRGDWGVWVGFYWVYRSGSRGKVRVL